MENEKDLNFWLNVFGEEKKLGSVELAKRIQELVGDESATREKIKELYALVEEGYFTITENLEFCASEKFLSLKEEVKKEEEVLKSEYFNTFFKEIKESEKKSMDNIFKNVVDFYKKQDEMTGREREIAADKIWMSLPVKSFTTTIVADKEFFEIEVEDKKIELEEGELLSPKSLIFQIFKKFGLMLPQPSKKTYSLLLMYWRTAFGKEERKIEKIETTEDLIRELVINYIERSFVTENLSETFTYNYIFLEDNCVLVPSEILSALIRTNGYKITMKKLGYILKDLLVKSSETRRVEGLGVKRFWFFDASKFNLKEKVSEEKENENSDNR